MYRPNFCCECGAKILRLHWRVWTSRRFCDVCSQRLLRERLTAPLIAAIALLGVGLIAGRAGRPAPPPLIIERHANSSLLSDQSENGPRSEQDGEAKGGGEVDGNNPTDPEVAGLNNSSNSQHALTEDVVYICGARTKKGTPRSRRVHGPVRCWQHKGMRPMLPPDKLAVKD